MCKNQISKSLLIVYSFFVTEHAELASYRRKPTFQSMIFSSSQLTTDGSYHTMDENGLSSSSHGLNQDVTEPAAHPRRNSTDSTGSHNSHSKPGEWRCM